MQASELMNMAFLGLESGDLDRATAGLRDAFGIDAAMNSNYFVPEFVRNVGLLAGLRGDARTCVLLTGASDAMYERAGLVPDPGDELSPRVIADAVAKLGGSDRSEDASAMSREEVLDLVARTLAG
jgi:hypothetical protein